jgi:hypothetical protein
MLFTSTLQTTIHVLYPGAVLDRDLVNTQHGRGVGIGRRSSVLCCCICILFFAGCSVRQRFGQHSARTRRWHRPPELCSLLLHMYSVLCWAKFFDQARKFSSCWTQLRSITPESQQIFSQVLNSYLQPIWIS